ncbi:MAG: efflux RND transporter periplasmic adaptor subunit [Flavobacteriales bacterium]|nr:efflux RND transporter periplasmic adaptor subunit [Flavobacteriales bacterium]
MKHPINFLLCACATTLLVACSSEGSTTAEPDKAILPTVRVVNPALHAIGGEITITGRVEPNEQVRVHAREGGYVKRVLKDIGDRVQSGDALAELDAPDLLQQLRQFEAEATAKRSIRDRIVSARASSPAITPAQLAEDAEADLVMAEAKLATTRERISFLTVRAPITGVITRRMVDPGALVQTGTTDPSAMALFELQAIDPVRIVVPVPARDAVHAAMGTKATIRFPDMGGAEVEAAISRTSHSLDAATGNMEVQLDVPNPDARIQPGMFATVVIRSSSADSALTLPTATSFAQGGEHFLMLVRDGRVVQVPMKKGVADKDRFQVMEPALTVHDQVIIEGRNLVREGDAVEPINQD